MKYFKFFFGCIVGVLLTVSTIIFADKNSSMPAPQNGQWFSCSAGKHVTGVHQSVGTSGGIIIYYVDHVSCG